MQDLLLGATYINFVFKLYYQYAQLGEINETMQHIVLLCSILILTKLFGSALQIVLGCKQPERMSLVIKLTAVVYMWSQRSINLTDTIILGF